jgi:tetratricopeptide (TPR) repeat protein
VVETSSTLIGRRYQLINQIGEGGMGAVYRALDRLTGQTVAVKRVQIPTQHLQFASRADENADLELTLAQEFKLLASLRHPNIISVLDYGFDSERQPYIAMEILENAQPVLESAYGQTIETKIDLLLQMLQALIYLHRRGILHRDLKSGNVLVVHGQAKVLDFGLSVMSEQAQTGEIAGTPSYMAPELWTGHPASKASDLYAMGVIAYKLLSGRSPFETNNLKQLYRDVMSVVPNVSIIDANEQVQKIVARLLAKKPQDRFSDAGEVAALLRQATDQSQPVETAATRESFLQAARFVGREKEMNQLSEQLAQAIKGHGSSWLIAGESGVGKSRILDELRTLALVGGALVLRGQAVAEGNLPYSLWRDSMRWLSLLTELDKRAASVLKALVPDIGKLLGYDVPDAPEIGAFAAQDRLMKAIESVFKAQRQPMLLILEDLHWADNESLAVLSRLTHLVSDMPLLIIGSFRDDERPDLPVQVPGVGLISLRRLDTRGTAELVEAMLGPVGRREDLQKLLQEETEGNAFFLVETVRALAEEAGQLSLIGSGPLPAQILTGGVQGIVRRRLNRVPEEARLLLETAAIAGRELDLDVIGEVLGLHKEDGSLKQWLTDAADAAVLEVHDDRWRFAHSKLRDGLLADLPDDRKCELHRQVAAAMENAYQFQPYKLNNAALAYHWGMAQDAAKEAHYAALAGDLSLHTGAYQVAQTFLKRALELSDQVGGDKKSQGRMMQQLGESYQELSDYDGAKQAYEQSLAVYTETSFQWGIATALNSLGSVSREVGDAPMARQYFRAALKKAMDVRSPKIALDTLTGIAGLMAKEGDQEGAVEYLALVLNHPSVEGRTADAAERLLNQLRLELPLESLEAASERGRERDWRQVASQLLAE